jgi:tetratricopeptide (TPR) repeat protein
MHRARELEEFSQSLRVSISILAGDFVRFRSLIAFGAGSRFRMLASALALIAFSALALIVFRRPASQTAPQQPQSPAAAAGANYCVQVKNTTARDLCTTANAEFYNGNYVTSMVMMTKAADASPKEGIPRAMAARIMFLLGNIGPAERELRQARKDGAPDHLVLPTLFDVMKARHEEVVLLSEFPEPAANAKGTIESDILQGRAMALQSIGRLAEAAAAMDRSLSSVRDSDGLLLRAKIASQQKDAALARNLVNEAYRIAPKDHEVMLAKLAQLEEADDTAGVLALSDQMLKLYPISIQARIFRIHIFLKQNQDARAEAELDIILARRPNFSQALVYKAVLLERAHDTKDAAQIILDRPIEFVKANPQYAIQMAQILIENGDVEPAEKVLGAALSTAPDLLEARLQLVNLRLSQNSPQSAQVLLTAVKDSPDPRVQKLLAQVRAKIAKDRAF